MPREGRTVAKPKVHVYQPIDETGKSYERMRAAGIDLKMPDEVWMDAANRRESMELALDPDTVVGVSVANRKRLVTRATLRAAPDLRLIAKYSFGFDNVDVDAAADLGILVVNSPTESNWAGVAEGTMAFMLALLKQVRERDRHVKQGGWRDRDLAGTFVGARLTDGYEGLTIGIIGLGRIGARLADLLAPWRVKLIAYDPYADESRFIHHNVKPVGFETLLRDSDVVTVHCNLTRETTRLIGAKELGLMKPD
jgi:phosphoglycerate dehydrogenase-like enzyme